MHDIEVWSGYGIKVVPYNGNIRPYRAEVRLLASDGDWNKGKWVGTTGGCKGPYSAKRLGLALAYKHAAKAKAAAAQVQS